MEKASSALLYATTVTKVSETFIIDSRIAMEFRDFFFEIWVGPQDDENFAKFGWVAALSPAGLSFAKFSRFVGALIQRNFREI